MISHWEATKTQGAATLDGGGGAKLDMEPAAGGERRHVARRRVPRSQCSARPYVAFCVAP